MININLFNQGSDIFLTIAIFLFGIFIINRIANALKTTKRRAFFLYIWHSFFCIVYAYLTITIMSSDALFYYKSSSQNILPDFKLGTYAVVYVAAIFTKGLSLSYLGVYLVFNIFGTIGLLAVDASLRHATENKARFVKILALIVILLPSMNFWTGSLGKDSIAYMSTGLLLWASIDFRRRNLLLLFAISCMFFVRPHIGGIMIVAFILSLLISKTLSPFKKVFFFIVSLIGMVTIIPFVLEYVGFGSIISGELAEDYIKQKQGFNIRGFDGGIDISSMPFILKMFTYIFRPLPFEAHNFLSFLSSIDNLIILVLFILSLFSVVVSKRKIFSLSDFKENRWFLLFFALGGIAISSLITSNFGISARQKWMFLPILIYFIFLFMNVKWSSKSKIR